MKINESNFATVEKYLIQAGITNKYAIAAILATVGKESNYEPKNENMNYSAKVLVEIFPSKFPNIEIAKQYEYKPYEIAERVYGGRYGNTAPGDGWKYRGRGFNGITFKDQYKQYGDLLRVDLITNPDKLNDIAIAAKANALYFLNAFNSTRGKDVARIDYGAQNINDFKDYDTALRAFTHANAGWGASKKVKDWSYNNALQFLPIVKEKMKSGSSGSSGVNTVPLIIAAFTFAALKNLF